MRRPHITAESGAYCPVPSASLRRKRMASGVYALTEIGLEKHCCRCDSYWPADTEFFNPQIHKSGGLHDWCKACYSDWRAEWRSHKKVAA